MWVIRRKSDHWYVVGLLANKVIVAPCQKLAIKLTRNCAKELVANLESDYYYEIMY